MEFMLYNVTCTDATSDKVIYRAFDINFAYSGRISKNGLTVYKNVAIPIKLDNSYITDESEFKSFLILHSNSNIAENDIKDFYIYNFFKANNMLDCKFTYQKVITISDSNMDVLYSDGSSQTKINKASFAAIELVENIDENNSDIYYSDDLEKYSAIKPHFGIIDSGTNNIGELNGVKTGLELEAKKDILLIISDSEYSIKSFREWIHTWKNNGYKGSSSKQPIKNSDLIKETYELMKNNKHKIILFKWVKGHKSNTFNKLCDNLAGYLLTEEMDIMTIDHSKTKRKDELDLARKIMTNISVEDVKVGDSIYIEFMEGRPDYANKKGIVNYIDDIGNIRGTWGSLSLNKEVDKFYKE